MEVAKSGRVMAHLLEPPGLGIRFPSRGALEAELPAHIESHLGWLRSHGEHVPSRSPSYQVREEVKIEGDFESGDDVGFYIPDLVPVSPDEVQRYLRIAGWAHADLLELVRPLSNDVLDWKPSKGTRTIRQIVLHVARAELWYMTRVIDDPSESGMPEVIAQADAKVDALPVAVVEALETTWEAFQRFARELPVEWRGRVTTPTWYASIPERWTARKMLRRCIEHCREHTRNVECLLATWGDRR